MAVIILENGSR